MFLLSFSTSSEMLSVALVKDNQVIKQENSFLGLRHSEKLLPIIKDILDASSFLLKDIDAFAVDVGPGSFTGLRIGLATLKGLTFGEKKRVIGISSLDALADKALSALSLNCLTDHFVNRQTGKQANRQTEICPIIDAKQDRVYTAIYEISKSSKLKRKTKYQVVKIVDLLKMLNKKKTVFLGDGLEKHRNFIAQQKKEVVFLSRKSWFPYASVIAKLGLEKLKKGKRDNIDLLSPMYLIPPKIGKSVLQIKAARNQNKFTIYNF